MPIFTKPRRPYHFIGAALMVALVAFCVIPLPFALTYWINEQAPKLLLIFLASTFIFLGFREYRLMTAALLACGALAIFLKKASSDDLDLLPYLARNQQPAYVATILDARQTSISVIETHLNDRAFNFACVIGLDSAALERLRVMFPHQAHGAGLSILSTYPLLNTRIISSAEAPILCTYVSLDSRYNPLCLLAFDQQQPASTDEDLAALLATFYLEPRLVFSRRQLAPWAHDNIHFRRRAGLKDARRDLDAIAYTPHHHLYFSEPLHCINFRGYYRIGCWATFQFPKVAYEAR